MLQKYLAGSGKVPNFAPANETEVSPQRGQKEQMSATAEKFKKKVAENFGNSKIGCNFAKPFGKSFRSAGQSGFKKRTLKELQ